MPLHRETKFLASPTSFCCNKLNNIKPFLVRSASSFSALNSIKFDTFSFSTATPCCIVGAATTGSANG